MVHKPIMQLPIPIIGILPSKLNKVVSFLFLVDLFSAKIGDGYFLCSLFKFYLFDAN